MPLSIRTPPSVSQLQRKNDELKSKISALKGEIKRLHRKLAAEETKNLSYAARVKALEDDRKKNTPQFHIVMNLGDDDAGNASPPAVASGRVGKASGRVGKATRAHAD